MSIVPLVRTTFYGPVSQKESVLEELQALGCLHLVPLDHAASQELVAGGPTAIREAIRFLDTAPSRRRRMVRLAEELDAGEIAGRVLEIRDRMHTLRDERDHLHREIDEAAPWGDFDVDALADRPDLRLWFYRVPRYKTKTVGEVAEHWTVVGTDDRFDYVVVVSGTEPEGMPAPRSRVGEKRLRDLERRVEEVEIELEDLQSERVALTRWLRLLEQEQGKYDDRAALVGAARATWDDGPIFALRAWAPRVRTGELRELAASRSLALEIANPSPDELPPTLLANPAGLAVGQDLVTFYMTPGYWLADPSMIVFFSFLLFFAMILGDFGYGAVLGLVTLLFRSRMKETEGGRKALTLFTGLSVASMVWGVLIGTYFGLAPPAGSFLDRLRVLDGDDFSVMMAVSVGIGASHIMLANLVDAWRRGVTAGALGPLGWVAIIVGALMLGTGHRPGAWVLGLGAAAVVLFTGAGSPIGSRVVQGLLGLTKVSAAFGDVLSYLRLFALGLASTALAVAFNDLAGTVKGAFPTFGVLVALIVLLVGHSLNFALGLMGGFVHGLRLNCIEFFNWSLPEEGHPFRAFAKKESPSWNR